ncbi:GAF domain-containing protein [Mesoterricola sediminis]|nr:GAF domain-containing protein [Mesoterricola sediminis]
MPQLAEKLAILNRALRRLIGAGTLPELEERILDVVEEVFGRDTAALLEVAPGGRTLRITASRGYDPAAVAAYQGRVGEGIAGMAALGEPRLVEDVRREAGYIPAVAGAVSEMAVPLVVEGRVTGVLDIESRFEAFDAGDMALFTAFAEHAAWALRHLDATLRSQERARRMELLHRARLALNESEGGDGLLDRILDLAKDALGFDSVAILLEERRTLVVRRARGREDAEGLRLAPGQGIAGAVFMAGRGEIVADVDADPRHIDAGGAGERCEMAVPMLLDGAVIGVLDAVSATPGAFGDLDLEIFTAFAAQVASALRQARHVDRIRAQARRLREIQRAGHALNARRDLEDRLDEILSAAVEALGLERVALLMVDTITRDLVVHSAVGYGDIIGKRIPVGEGVTGKVAETGVPAWVEDVREHPGYLEGVTGGRTEMAVPLRVFGELIGVLDTESPDPYAFGPEDLELLGAFGDQVAVALHNARLIQGLEDANARMVENMEEMGRLNWELESYAKAIQEANHHLGIQVRQLTAIHEAGQAITSSLDLNRTLEVILRTTGGIVNASAGAIKLIDEETKEFKVKAASGKVVDPGAPFQKLDLPLRIGDKTIGVFELFRSAGDEMDETERKMLETLASQASIAIENARLFEDTQRTYYETLRSLAKAIEARDDYTRGHSERVAELSLATARGLGLPDAECSVIFNSALLHDIGKIGVRDAVLLSENPLTPAEMEIIRKHPTYSNTILGPLKFLGQVAEYVKYHHESWDGTGYPKGLKGEEIPYYSRIITVADAYDAMTSTRPYRKAKTHEEALAELRRMSGKQFDPKIVDAFARVMSVGRD